MMKFQGENISYIPMAQDRVAGFTGGHHGDRRGDLCLGIGVD